MTSNGRERNDRNERKGVLPRQALRVLIDQGHISSSIEIPDRNIQPASIDLTLGDVAYRLRCSFLPGTSLVPALAASGIPGQPFVLASEDFYSVSDSPCRVIHYHDERWKISLYSRPFAYSLEGDSASRMIYSSPTVGVLRI